VLENFWGDTKNRKRKKKTKWGERRQAKESKSKLKTTRVKEFIRKKLKAPASTKKGRWERGEKKLVTRPTQEMGKKKSKKQRAVEESEKSRRGHKRRKKEQRGKPSKDVGMITY